MANWRRLAWTVALAGLSGALVALVTPPVPTAPPTRRFDDPDAAAAYEYRRRMPTTAGMDTAALYERAESLVTRATRYRKQGTLGAWESLGPGNIGGRTRVVRFHPTRPSTIFAAGVSGGVWRLDEIGGVWRTTSDTMTNIAVNALAIDRRQPETMYAGTGEGFLREEIRGTGLPLRGGGIFVTRDGAMTWQRLAATATSDFYWVNDLELGVGDTRRIYAATRTGVWRSLDGGDSWTPLVETAVRAGCLDLAIRPDVEDDFLLASCGSYEQATVYRIRSASGRAEVEVVLHEPNMGRTSVAIAPSNPDVMYAMAASNDPGPDGNYEQALLAVYRSSRAGDPGSWETRVSNRDPVRLNTLLLTNLAGATARDCSSNPNTQNTFVNMGWYVNVLAVDPRDPDRVWAGGVDWLRSDDGGRNWGVATSYQGAAASHVDQHGIAFHPNYDGATNQEVLIGNDGGVYRSTNARGPTATGPRAACTPGAVGVAWQTLNRGYGVTQFYQGVPFANGRRYIGGAQDNGTVLGGDAEGSDGWRTIFGGDGSYTAVADDGNTLYVQSQFSNIGRSTNGGASFQPARAGLDDPRFTVLGPQANFLFITPLVMDPTDPQRLWIGGEYLYRTVNRATLWTKASTAMPDGSLVSAISISARDANRVAAGTTRGHIVRHSTALQTTSSTEWLVARPRDGWVTSVAHDPATADALYATYGNFGGSHVFRSGDGGATWASLDGTGDGALPDIPVHSILVDPDDATRLFLGTDVGVFVSVDRGARWVAESTGYGPAVTEWLALTRDADGRKLLFAFTHGRGVWRVTLP